MGPTPSNTTYIKRNIDTTLYSWSNDKYRKPLILRGARQVGKTSTVRNLGRSFDLFVEMNLEKHSDARIVKTARSAEDLLVAIRARHDVVDFPERTLLFLDEIQESPEAVGWLRHLHEDHPGIRVIAAGSLLEVRLERRGLSFPVGRVTFDTMRPFTFLEYASARAGTALPGMLAGYANTLRPIPGPIHDSALDLLSEYVRVGGMPEAVSRTIAGGGPAAVRRVHDDLVQSLAEDIQKYRGTSDIEYLEAAFAALPMHYGRRFKYEGFAPGYPSSRMKDALGKLEAAMLVTRVQPTSSREMPLRPRARSAPKLLPLDTGLALRSLGVTGGLAPGASLDSVLDGRLAEMVAGLGLLASGRGAEGLFFWTREGSEGSAEVDYLLPVEGGAIPVEVKAGTAGTLRSLHSFMQGSGRRTGIRLWSGNLADERHAVKLPAGGSMEYRLVSIPLYLAEMVPRIAEAAIVSGITPAPAAAPAR